MNIQRETTISTLDEMCALMCGGTEDELDKKDMTFQCGFKSEDNWYNAHVNKTLDMDEYYKWYDNNCAKCIYASEVCMYGED